MKIQDTLSAYLSEKNMTQRDFCRLVGISQTNLSLFLNGRKKGRSIAERIYPILFEWLNQQHREARASNVQEASDNWSFFDPPSQGSSQTGVGCHCGDRQWVQPLSDRCACLGDVFRLAVPQPFSASRIRSWERQVSHTFFWLVTQISSVWLFNLVSPAIRFTYRESPPGKWTGGQTWKQWDRLCVYLYPIYPNCYPQSYAK